MNLRPVGHCAGTGKLCYAGPAAAWQAARYTLDPRRHKSHKAHGALVAFRCRLCGSWHLGSRRRAGRKG